LANVLPDSVSGFAYPLYGSRLAEHLRLGPNYEKKKIMPSFTHKTQNLWHIVAPQLCVDTPFSTKHMAKHQLKNHVDRASSNHVSFLVPSRP
jgi:hypothetical protein